MPNDPIEGVSHPVLALMEASTKATEGQSARLAAVEKSIDGLADRVGMMANSMTGAFEQAEKVVDKMNTGWKTQAAVARERNEVKKRQLALEEAKLALVEQRSNERWTRMTTVVKGASSSTWDFAKLPWVTLPLGAIGYGLAKLIADWFGFDMSALP